MQHICKILYKSTEQMKDCLVHKVVWMSPGAGTIQPTIYLDFDLNNYYKKDTVFH